MLSFLTGPFFYYYEKKLSLVEQDLLALMLFDCLLLSTAINVLSISTLSPMPGILRI